MTQPARVGIVGGGLLGMTMALRLRQQGHSVTLIEGAASPGGLALPQELGGYTWDRFYHVVLQSDLMLRDLLGELKMEDRLQWRITRTGFFVDGKLLSMSSGLDFLRFPPLSLIDKARLGLTILYASRLRDWRELEATPVSEWLRRWSGTRTFQRIWLPLLKSKLGDNYRLTSAAFIWAIIARMYAARRAGMKREMMGYIDGGYDGVLKRFREHLQSLGVEILCGRPVTEVHDQGEIAVVTLAGSDTREFSAVILTVPATRIPQLCPQLSAAEQERLAGVTYMGIACASLLLRRPLADYYVTNITDAWVPFTAVIEMTALVDRERFGGNSLVYLPRYLTQQDAYWGKSDDDIKEEFLAALQRMYPAFSRNDVLAFSVSRVREVLALSTLNYSVERLPRVRTSLPRVFIVNSAQIANGTLNVNETVALANAKAVELAPQLAATRTPLVNAHVS